MFITTLIRKEFILPLTRRKLELEIQNTKLMALFAEIDPDPILRIDDTGKILSANKTALEIFKYVTLIGSNINQIIPNISEFENANANDNYISEINNSFYSITIKDVESLDFRQIYLHDITKRIKYERQIEQYQVNLRQLRTKLENINENEKQRLGKELHDGIGQNLSVIKIELQNYLDRSNIENKDVFSKLIDLIDNLSDEIREISHQLRPRILNEFGLIPALSSLIDSVNNNSPMKGLLSSTEGELKLSQELELNIYRICQAALTNIVKHSDCKNFFIQFVKSGEDLRLIISDDGKGFDVNVYKNNGSSSLGLLNMKERITNFGGKMNLISSEGEGTTIFFNLPLLK